MQQRTRWAGTSALVLATALAVAGALGQTKPVSRPGSAPYTHEAIAEISKLKPVVNNPSNPGDLQAIQDRVEAVVKNALPAIVNLIVSDGQGSGVIISKDGYILTAGHVSGTPHKKIYVRLSNGTVVEGESLGADNQWDAGMVKITTPGNYSFMPVATSAGRNNIGQWAVTMGHPGGWEEGRQPVVRLGKIIGAAANAREWYIQTDCPMIMGDSGGPVFDLDGRVVGINSRIGIRSTSNVHVPIDAFTQDWDRLVKGDQWGKTSSLLAASPAPPTPQSGSSRATLRLNVRPDSDGVFINNVGMGSGSEKAGVQPEDVITKLNGHVVKSAE